MDHVSFDRLTLRLGRLVSRRATIGALGVLALPGLVDAKKKRKRKRRKKKPCRPESPATTCAGRCGTVPNNCRQEIECLPCPSGQFCLSNGSCADECAEGGCPLSCTCPGLQYPTAEGAHFCQTIDTTCSDSRQVCESTSDCPLGFVCQLVPCGPGGMTEGNCIPLCYA